MFTDVVSKSPAASAAVSFAAPVFVCSAVSLASSFAARFAAFFPESFLADAFFFGFFEPLDGGLRGHGREAFCRR